MAEEPSNRPPEMAQAPTAITSLGSGMPSQHSCNASTMLRVIGLVLTGPITRNMVEALQLCWDGMPEPKLVIAVGACAISGGLFEGSSAIERGFLERFTPTLYVPGCPP